MRDFQELVEAARDVLGFYNYPGGYRPGGFTTALIEAFEKADTDNFDRLSYSFPAMGRVLEVMRRHGAEGLNELIKHGEDSNNGE